MIEIYINPSIPLEKQKHDIRKQIKEQLKEIVENYLHNKENKEKS